MNKFQIINVSVKVWRPELHILSLCGPTTPKQSEIVDPRFYVVPFYSIISTTDCWLYGVPWPQDTSMWYLCTSSLGFYVDSYSRTQGNAVKMGMIHVSSSSGDLGRIKVRRLTQGMIEETFLNCCFFFSFWKSNIFCGIVSSVNGLFQLTTHR